MFKHIKKTDSALQIIYAEVYVPNVPDSDGEFMTTETVREMAHHFLRKGDTTAIDIQHENERIGAAVVESFVAREDDTLFIPESWVVGIHIPSAPVWKMIEDGDINGLSLEALVQSREKEVELEVPESFAGETEPDATDHEHTFDVTLDENGKITEGQTGTAEDGHFHLIKKATVTEEAGDDKHTHRFSFMEGLNIAEEEN